MRTAMLVLAALWSTTGALAQSAMVQVTHDDPDGLVDPGQTIKVALTISWTGLNPGELARIAGDLEATPDIGTATNPTGIVPWYSRPDPTMTLGTAVNGSVRNHEMNYYIPPFFRPIILPPFSNNTGIHVVGMDWTAPATPSVVASD